MLKPLLKGSVQEISKFVVEFTVVIVDVGFGGLAHLTSPITP